MMATSRNYEELSWTWDAWRNASGKHMKKDFEELVRLLNKAAIKNGW